MSINKKVYTCNTCTCACDIIVLFEFFFITICFFFRTGGHSKYFVDNITNFHFQESVFDLALLAGLKTVIIVTVLPVLENKSYEQIDNPFDRSRQNTCFILKAVLKVIFLGSLVYSFTKGGMILDCILNDSTYVRMHVTYNVLVISSATFSLLEFLLSLFSGRAMRRLKVVRILHRYNDKGQEIDKEGNPIKKKVDLRRLVKLGKPVSFQFHVALSRIKDMCA